ncbi:MAG: glycosyltransferase [Candidatus Peribacteraceae bacterium]|nr:glycosyltransferase [Candidatus Peribacteraceae bacterium]
MTILAFGYHDRQSPRHRTVCDVLAQEYGPVVECHTEKKGFFAKCADLRRKFRVMSPDAQTVIVPFPGHFLMPLAWWLTRKPRRQLIFDAFISLYDTDVSDRRRYSPLNPRAWMLWWIDIISVHLADEVLIDTEEHKKFFVKHLRLNPKRVRVIYLEARKDLFHPKQKTQISNLKTFEIFFYGTLIPLQGVDYILQAAKILQDRDANVHFTLVGSSKFPAMIERAGLRNVTTTSFVPMEELPQMIRSAHLCLGIFGTSDKAQRVIPHKVVDAVACGVPVLTADTPAIRERFANHPLVHLIPARNAQAIANSIDDMINNRPTI